jgi:hypothetical protein
MFRLLLGTDRSAFRSHVVLKTPTNDAIGKGRIGIPEGFSSDGRRERVSIHKKLTDLPPDAWRGL